jgi:ABC-2 type transport system ATP-binding protein
VSQPPEAVQTHPNRPGRNRLTSPPTKATPPTEATTTPGTRLDPQSRTSIDSPRHTAHAFRYRLTLLGPNGSGKSTTIRTLLDFQRPTSGRATVLGLDSRRDSVAIRQQVGYVPGELHLFERMTGSHLVSWCSRARGGHDESLTSELVERFGVTLDRPVRELSKGNRQKVGLLLAFMHRPELVILDEPSTGLDPLVQVEFEGLLRETVSEGRTVLLSSHTLDEVQRVADRVAIIRDGRLVVTDTIERLRAAAPRVMCLEFPAPVDPAAFASLSGTTASSAEGSTVTVRFSGAVAPILRIALDHDLVDLEARHADLEELFLTYFHGDDEQVPNGPA